MRPSARLRRSAGAGAHSGSRVATDGRWDRTRCPFEALMSSLLTTTCAACGPVDLPVARSVRRLGMPEGVAEAAVYLASDGAGFVTGETLGVSGGMGIGA